MDINVDGAAGVFLVLLGIAAIVWAANHRRK